LALPRKTGGWGAISYSLKMARRAGGLWPMLRALTSRNKCKSCALGMGGQKGGMRDEQGHFPAVCNKSFVAQASDMQVALSEQFFLDHSADESGNEFHIEVRTLHNSEYPTPGGKANFKVCPIPAVRENRQNRFILMKVRSEGQFNTVVYDTEVRYR
jgi:hypothetical protein